MKKQFFMVCAVCFVLLPIFSACGQEGLTGTGGGFTGPSSTTSGRGQAELVTVAAAKTLRDDTRVTLQGTIVSQLSREKYTFRDSTGEITLDIDRKVWRGLTVGETDRVEVYGEVDVERRGTQIEIDVKTITKL